MKLSTFNDGIRKSSLNCEFNAYIPVVIHSNIWNKNNHEEKLEEFTKKILGRIRTYKLINLKCKPEMYDHYLYIISSIFNELSIGIFNENAYPCEEILKGFTMMHHLLLILNKKYPIEDRCIEIIDHLESLTELNKKAIPIENVEGKSDLQCAVEINKPDVVNIILSHVNSKL